MGLVGNLKDLYYSVEGGYYKILDKVNTVLPVYKVIDPIDKLFPSFLLVILIVALLAVYILLPVGLVAGGNVNFALVVEDESGTPLEGVSVSYRFGGESSSMETGPDGRIELNLPVGTELELKIRETTIGGVKFNGLQKTVSVFEEGEEILVLISKRGTATNEKTIVMQYASGERIKGKTIVLRLSCESGETPIPQTVSDTDKDGMIEVKEPANCGMLQATVIEPAEFEGNIYLLTNSTTIIKLQKAGPEGGGEPETGNLRVKVQDASGNWLEETNFEVTLRDKDGFTLQTKFTEFYAEAIFREVLPGTYSLSISDRENNYGIATKSSITVRPNETASVSVVLSKSLKGVLKITAVDSLSSGSIAGAKIRLVDAGGKTVEEDVSSELGGAVEFALSEDGNYTVYASHEDYLYGELDLDGAVDGDFDVFLDPMTPENSGIIEVKVVDEFKSAVDNAKVKLRFLENDFMAPYEPQITDFNGGARFAGVKEGAYYAYVEKFPASGDNKEEGREIDLRETNFFTVNVFIGTTTLNVSAVTEEGELIPESVVEFYSLTGQKLGQTTLTNGQGAYTLKADRKVYVLVRHPQYQTFQTIPVQLYPNIEINFTATMRPRLISGKPEIDFLGIYAVNGEEAQQFNAGQKYVAKFRFSIPENVEYSRAGVHFRVGDGALLQNEPMAIIGVRAGNIDTLLKGTTFTPPKGYRTDLENLTEGDAKWINFDWFEVEPRDYIFGFTVRVKSQVIPESLLSMHYRSWAKTEDNDYIRSPFDEVLGTGRTSSEKQSQYANKYSLEFYEGRNAFCENSFCYSGEWVYGEAEELYIYPNGGLPLTEEGAQQGPMSYDLEISSGYTLNFNIINNAEVRYTNSNLYITNLAETLEINSYTITDADARKISDENLKTFEISEVGLGNFTKGKSVNANLKFTPKSIGSDSLEVKIIADSRIVFSRIISIHTKSSKRMEIGIEPEYIGSYSPVELAVTVREIGEFGQNLEIEDVLVRVSRISPDKSKVSWENTTDKFGRAMFAIPGSLPNTAIVIEAEKVGYTAEKVVVLVDSNVLNFEPKKINASLNLRGTREVVQSIKIENKTWNDLEIKGASVNGRFRGLLDIDAMSSYLETMVGTELEAFSEENYDLFKIRLSRNAEDYLQGGDSVDGDFLLTIEDPEILAEYDFVIPFKVNILVGGLPENAPCITFTRKGWSAVTKGNQATIEFEIHNSCVSAEKFIGLENLKGRIQWQSDEIGVVEIALTNAETGERNIEILQTNLWTTFFRDVRPNTTYYATVTFTPKTGHFGEDAMFFIEIDGEVLTDAGLQLVGSMPNRIQAEIKVVNFRDCITFPEAESGIVLGNGEQSEQTFSVNTELCGETPIEIFLCYSDPGCSGGTGEGYIQLSSDRFTINPANPQKEVTVGRGNMAGMYGISVFARFPGMAPEKANEVLVEVEVDPAQYFSLDKYNFSLIGEGGVESATITNRMLQETVAVTASVCDWGKKSSTRNLGDGWSAFWRLSWSKMFADKCDKDYTGNLEDYVINLGGGDFQRAYVKRYPGSVKVSNYELVKTVEEKTEKVGIVLTKEAPLPDADPSYDILKIEVTEHIHSDETHYAPRKYVGNSNFEQFRVPDTHTKTHTEQFHIRIRTKNIPQSIPPIDDSTAACLQGTMTGRSGEGALPKIKLDWSWGNAGIPADACDYGNPNGIYCDATQFSIATSKKIYQLDEFLKANNSFLMCPEDEELKKIDKKIEKFNSNNSSHSVDTGKVGLELASSEMLSTDSARITAKLFNDTGETQTVEVSFGVKTYQGYDYDQQCAKSVTINSKQRAELECVFGEVPQNRQFFISSAVITNYTPGVIDSKEVSTAFRNWPPPSQSECWLRYGTGHYGETQSAIEKFANATRSITWTKDIRNLRDLGRVVKFKANLVKDNYSDDFKEDFAKHYINLFFGAPSWFADDPNGKFADYFLAGDERLEFAGKFGESPKLPAPGVYEVELSIDYSENSPWRLYNASGDPIAQIKIIVYKLDDPYPDSVFYYIPFNGNVGRNSNNGRQGYGVNYNNADKDLVITSTGDLVTTETLAVSNPATWVETKTEYDFKKINSSYANLGLLVKVSEGNEIDSKKIMFYPNYATPVLLKMKHGIDDEPFQALYELLEAGTPVETGGNLAFWSGAGKCLDYSGVPVAKAFDYQTDRPGKKTDPVTNWEFLYGIDWEQVSQAGDVYLKTVFYTPINNAFSLKAVYPEELGFMTPNSNFAGTIDLRGIDGMPFNSRANSNNVNELGEVFDLVRTGKVCVTSSGNETSFWWNPQAVYETTGSYNSIEDFELGLVAGEDCLDFPK